MCHDADFIITRTSSSYMIPLLVLLGRIKQANDEPKAEDTHAAHNVHSGSASSSVKNHATKKISKKESEEANPLLTKELEHAVGKQFSLRRNFLSERVPSS